MKRTLKPRNLLWLLVLPFLWWGLRQAPWGQIWRILSSLSLVQLILLLIVNTAIFALFSSRWWLILRAQGYNLPFRALVGYRLSSFAISYFTPGTQFGGEPLQVYMLKNRHGLPAAAALASVTLDKLFELLANFTFLIVGFVLILGGGLISEGIELPILVAAAVLLSLPLLYLLALWSGRAPLTWLAGRLPGRRRRRSLPEKATALVGDAESQISYLMRRRSSAIWWAFMLSGLIWFAMLGEYWLSLYLLGGKLTLSQTIIAMTAARLAFLTPLPGGLGALEASQAFALNALGYGPALGISASLLIRGRDVLFGLLGLWWGALLVRRKQSYNLSPPPDHLADPSAMTPLIQLTGGKTHE